MSEEKFTPGEWYLGNPFRHKDTMSEWCNLYADGEKNPIAVVLLNDGCGKTYHNDALLKAAPEMYAKLKTILVICEGNLLRKTRCDVLGKEINEILKKARGEK